MHMIFTVKCKQCPATNQWDANRPPKTLKLLFEGGYSIVCLVCRLRSKYRDLGEIKVSQFQ